MTTTIAQVREALADACKVQGLQVSPYPADQITPPAAMVLRKRMDPRMVFSAAKSVYQFGLVVYVARADERSGAIAIDRYCETTGDWSIKQAVEDGANWPSNLVDYAQVTSIGETQVAEVAGAQYLIVEFDIEVVF